MKVLETERLVLRRLTDTDAPFILQLVNEPSWLRFIGDKDVKTIAASRDFIANGPVAMYHRHGFGLYRVELKERGIPIGICGLIRRDALEQADVGFAFLPQFWSKGYAFESAAAVMEYGRRELGMARLLAVVSPENEASARLLAKLGFHFERVLRLAADGPEVRLFAADP